MNIIRTIHKYIYCVIWISVAFDKERWLMLKSPGSEWSAGSGWFVWQMYLCHYEERALLFKPGSDFKVICPLSRLLAPLTLHSLSLGLSCVTPPLWPYLHLKYHKVYWKSCNTRDISIHLHISSVYWALLWNLSMQAHLSRLCQPKGVSRTQWTLYSCVVQVHFQSWNTASVCSFFLWFASVQ